MNMEGSNKPINFDRLWSQILNIVDIQGDKLINTGVLSRIREKPDYYLVNPIKI